MPARNPNKQCTESEMEQPISPTNKQTGTQNKIQEISAESPYQLQTNRVIN